MEWLKLFDDLSYEKAMRKVRKIKRDEATLRRVFCNGNYSDVKMQLAFDGPGQKRYAVWVLPLETKDITSAHEVRCS